MYKPALNGTNKDPCLCTFRLLTTFAEEQATEDAIYYLGEALRKEVIDLEVFMKVSLSQF